MNPLPEPEVTTLEEIERRSGYQSLEPVTRPPYWGVDLDPSRRPGVPMERAPAPWPNTRFPPEQQPGEPATPMHGRPNKPMPAVFGTVLPLHGVSGAIRRFGYGFPDHKPQHWLLKLFADRVESFGYHAKKYLPFALPFVAGLAAVRLLRGRSERSDRTAEYDQTYGARVDDIDVDDERLESTYNRRNEAPGHA